MMHLNLLPWRTQKHRQQQRIFLRNFFIVLAISLSLIIFIHYYFIQQLNQQNLRNNYLQIAINSYQLSINQIEQITQQGKQIEVRINTLQHIQSAQHLAGNILAIFANALPVGIYLTAMQRQNSEVILQGTTTSYVQVAQLLRNINTIPLVTAAKLATLTNDPKNSAMHHFVLEITTTANLEQ